MFKDEKSIDKLRKRFKIVRKMLMYGCEHSFLTNAISDCMPLLAD